MELKTFLKSLPDDVAREKFADACDTSAGHLRNISYGQRPCAPALAVAIEKESKRQVTRRELCPEDWAKVWPELIGALGAPSIEATPTTAEQGDSVQPEAA